MSNRGSLPLRLRVSYLALPAALLFVAGSFPAIAQSQNNDNFSSSSQGLVAFDADPALPASPSPAMAAGQNGTYGYHSNNWSSRLAFEAGGGGNAPIGNDQPFITWGGNFTVGAGYKFTDRLSALIEYQFMDNKLPGGLIADAGAEGGHAHIWSLTVDPVFDLFPKAKNSVYVTGGGGFYRKVTSFTDPEEVEECYYFCGIGYENVVVSHFSSNQGGVNGGIGFTHRLGDSSMGYSNMKLYAEARYVWINTPGLDQTDGLGTTGLIPVTLGVRW
ncbi:porin family protein [Acidicapsa dinghuensis]|uniref:Porin family protein n=1 Tax=Acidicapsa dinghuensis TaxID=2218256 RepID=A0ABW1EIF5_9BACT|nr:porin family protein [Acidicapsa dinghuensis]